MKNKKERLRVVLEIIKNNCIGSQEDLSVQLKAKGFDVTQATLSRDLKILKISKVPTDFGGYVYIIPDGNNIQDKMLSSGKTNLASMSNRGFISINFSKNIAVIKTRNGYAAGLAYDIDMSKTPEILGTIAGADTVIAILKEGIEHSEAMQIFSKFLPITIEPI